MLISALSSIAGWIFEYIHESMDGADHLSSSFNLNRTGAGVCRHYRLVSPVTSCKYWANRAAYHHLRALYSPWQHLQPNIWVEISQISPEEMLAQTVARTSSPETWNWAETETRTPLISLKSGWLVRAFISRLNDCVCYSGAFDQVY